MKTPTGGASGFFKRLWYAIKLLWIGMKANLVEILTPHRKFDLKKVPRRPGEIAVITGAARGIGIEVVKMLLILDMHVVLGCRSESSGLEAIEKIRKSGINTGTADVVCLDLTSLESVRSFGSKVSLQYPKIHVLISNAGIMMVPYSVTKDGFESQFQVNYLSHFLLTNLLLPRLISAGRAGKASRIVNVSSAAHYGGFINFDDINMQLLYSKDMAYMSSKLMQVVNTRDLDAKLKKEGVHVNVHAVHPGVVKTDLYDHVCIVKTFGFLFRLIYKSPAQGADGVTFAAISSKFEGTGGLYFENCKKKSVNSLAKDPQIQKRLWELSCKLSGWDDIPFSDIVKQAVVSRKPNTKSDDDTNDNIPVKAVLRKESSSSVPRKASAKQSVISTSLDLDGLDDLLASFDQDDENDKNSDSSDASKNSSVLEPEEPRSSISTTSSTKTVIENVDVDKQIDSHQVIEGIPSEGTRGSVVDSHVETTNSVELATPITSNELPVQENSDFQNNPTTLLESTIVTKTELDVPFNSSSSTVPTNHHDSISSVASIVSNSAYESTSSFSSFAENSYSASEPSNSYSTTETTSHSYE